MNRADSTYILMWSKKIKAVKLLGEKCECCGETNIFKLCFHHKNPKEKEFEISYVKNNRWSLFKKEILKCQLLCNNCHKELHHKLEKNEKSFYINNKEIFLTFKNQFGCCECGYNKDNALLCFHHKNPKEKEFGFGDFRIRISSIDDLLDSVKYELEKCDVLCHNCHVEKHQDIDRFNKFKSEIYQRVDGYKELREPLDRDVVLEMYKSGKRQKEIVEHFNCAKSTISMIIKKYS